MKDLSKKTKLTIIGILSLTVLLVIGITYAYFTAATITGNSGANSIQVVTGTHGNITVNYLAGNGTISMNNIDLREAEQGTTQKEIVKFSVNYPGSEEEKITIMWKEVTNTFCQYQTGNVCTNTSTDTYVGDEIYFKLYECNTESALQSATTTTQTNCSEITRSDKAVPITSEEKRLQNDFSISLTNTTKYYLMILNIDNITALQDYNQGRTFNGRIEVTKATTDLEGVAQVEGVNLSNGIVQMESVLRVTKTDGQGYYKFENVDLGNHTITIKNSSNATIATKGITIQKGSALALSDSTITSEDDFAYVNMNTSSSNINLTIPQYLSTFSKKIYSSAAALGYKLLTDNEVIKTTTAATVNKGAAPAAGTDIVNENGIYRASDDDGYSYYYRGGEGCSVLGDVIGVEYPASGYSTYETCKANKGAWLYAYPYDSILSYKCYANGTPEVCESNGGTWYYLNNNVSFAGFKWKVVRINGDGSIRIVLDGITSAVKKEGSSVYAGSNAAYNHNLYLDTDIYSGVSTRIGTTLEEQAKAKAYASYTGSDTPVGEEGGELESAINLFYETYIDNGTDIDYSSYLADSSFCSDTTWGDTSESYWDFAPATRLDTNLAPSYLCPVEVTYKVGGTTGIRLTYPITTLTVDEAAYAGGKDYISNSGYYLSNPLTINRSWWTMSPYAWISNGFVFVFDVGGDGLVDDGGVRNGDGVRAVLNLNSEVLTAGGNGTEADPCIIGN